MNERKEGTAQESMAAKKQEEQKSTERRTSLLKAIDLRYRHAGRKPPLHLGDIAKRLSRPTSSSHPIRLNIQ